MPCCHSACGGGAREGTVPLTCLSLAHFPMNSRVRLGVSPTLATTVVHCQLSLSFAFSQPCPHSPLPLVLTGLVVLVDFFFNSLVVGVPWSLIFWRFWFIDFRLVVILPLVVREAKGFYLHLHLGWNSHLHQIILTRKNGCERKQLSC